MLAALASCLTAGVAAVAQYRGIQLRSVTATVEGNMNVLGILGADPEVRNGFNGVKVHFDIDADASPRDIEALVAQSQKRSAVFDIMTNPTNVVVDDARPADPDPRLASLTNVTTVVIGAGHAGLAMSRRLTERSIDHVVLERGEVANSWRTERWDSLRLLTPNWQTRLPGMADQRRRPRRLHDDARGRATSSTTTPPASTHRCRPARRSPASTATDGGYAVATDRGVWRCATVGARQRRRQRRHRPALAAEVPPSVAMVTPMTTARPRSSTDGGVLVVGASATGVQLADEIQRSGRQVTLAVGEHVRMPRTYRGRDIFWWMDAAGVLDERHDEVDDLVRARHVPSPQLIGTPERRSIDLNTLADSLACEIVGRLGSVRDGVAQFSGGLANTCRLADLKLNRLLDRFDEWATAVRTSTQLDDPHRPRADRGAGRRRRSKSTCVAAGSGRSSGRPAIARTTPGSTCRCFDRRGRIRHDGGVVQGAPGVYLLGGNLLRTRRSSYISGAAEDSRAIADHLHQFQSTTRSHSSSHLLAESSCA